MKKLLKSKLKATSTEEIFDLLKQPEDTCPMIDNAINILFKAKTKYYASDIPSVQECEICTPSKTEDLNNVRETVEDILFELDFSLSRDDEDLLHSNLRNLCCEVREFANNIKEELWNSIEETLDGNILSFNPNKLKIHPINNRELKELVSGLKGYLDQNYKTYEYFHLDNNVGTQISDLKNLSCSAENCIGEENDESECFLEDVADEMNNFIQDIQFEADDLHESIDCAIDSIKDAEKNLDNIVEWAEDVCHVAQEFIDDPINFFKYYVKINITQDIPYFVLKGNNGHYELLNNDVVVYKFFTRMNDHIKVANNFLSSWNYRVNETIN